MKKIVITGGTGFIGMSLAHFLRERDYEPILIARNEPIENPFTFVKWDGFSLGKWIEELEGVDAVVNLAGKTVDCIKTPDNCDLILRSRVDSTTVLGKALRAIKSPPKVWIQMATAHIYGDPPSQICSEDSSFGFGLAPIVGKAWEEAFLSSKPDEVRGVRLRTSFVVGKGGGALKSLQHIVRLGLGGTAGKGTQGMSWIHEFDMNNLILECIEKESYNGAYIASSPNPVSNKEFMQKLRKEMNVRIGLPGPEFMIRFGAKTFFNTDPELVLYGRYVVSQRLKEEGFEFKFPFLEEALKDLV